MLKQISFAVCTIFLSSITVVGAAPLDVPGTVYIDGLPCNRACQDYMMWSRQVSGQPEGRADPMAAHPSTIPRPPRNAKKSEPARPARVAMLPSTTREAHAKNPADGVKVKPAAAMAKSVPTPPLNPRSDPETSTSPPSPMVAVPQTQEPAQLSPPAPAPSAESKPAPLVAAVVEPPSDARTTPNTDTATDTNTAALATSKVEQTIAIILVREEIKSLADLSNKKIAIDASQTSEVPGIKTAISNAGASNVEVSEDRKFALGRVMDGEVPAGIITLASPEEAAQWTGVPGFTVLKLPLGRLKGARG